MIKHYLALATLIFIALNSSAQKSKIEVFPQDNQQFTGDKIINGLVSYGVKIVDVETNFSSESHVMGFFIDPVSYMGINQGMILSTGVVDNVTSENSQENYTSLELDLVYSSESEEIVQVIPDSLQLDPQAMSNLIQSSVKSGDSDLSKEINGLQTYDARVVEIKFIPSADTLYYRYVFASEEYDEYVCSPYNDVFAFYLSEDGQKKRNIALVPNQDLPISINTVNAGNPSNPYCESTNSYLYQRNDGSQKLLYDGFTKVLDIREKVIPGKEYKLKIAIADASDGFWDSAVLIENGSIFSYFSSYEVQFDKNSSETTETEKLDEMLEVLKEHPKSKIQLIGHADQVGPTKYNFKLSIKRVSGIKEYLLVNGIDTGRILEVHKGETMPRYEDDYKNRRVEAFVMGE